MCFRPDTQALRLQNVNLYCLRHVGVKVLMLDADNTLSPWNSPELSPEVVGWVEGAKAAGFAVLVAGAVQNLLFCRCPHCGRSLSYLRMQPAEFCPYCGERL